MIRAETLDSTQVTNQSTTTKQAGNSGDTADQFSSGHSLRESVTIAVRQYLKELDGQMATDVYGMVLAEVETPLLQEIMAYTRNNQTKASIMLGLNRGTLRKKLKQYKLISPKN